ncbi:MAG: sulfatase [Acidobacteriota bacterium]
MRLARRLGLALALPVLAGCGAGRVSAPPPPARRPNVILITVDTLRRDHLSCYGYARHTSPNIDRLAARGLRFDDAYSQAPWTTPSIGALLTSRYPTELGIHDAPDRLADRFITLAEMLRGAGYRTGAVISHFFIDSEWNFQQGFESFDQSNVLGHRGISSPGVTRQALAFARAHAGEPFFLWAHYFDPHYDYLEHPGFRFGDAAGYHGPINSQLQYTELVRLLPTLTDRDRQRLLDLYDSEIAFTDHSIGRLLDGLRKLRLLGDSLVVLTADHGEEFLDHQGVGHGGTLYNEVIHVPLIIKLPGPQAPHGVVRDPAGLIDVYPTIAAALGIVPGEMLRGQSLLAQRPAERASEIIWSETDWGKLRAVIDDRTKLILNLENGSKQLFYLPTDPAERHNLIAGMGGRPLLQQEFARLDHRLRGELAEISRAAIVAPHARLPDELQAQLRALGYLR